MPRSNWIIFFLARYPIWEWFPGHWSDFLYELSYGCFWTFLKTQRGAHISASNIDIDIDSRSPDHIINQNLFQATASFRFSHHDISFTFGAKDGPTDPDCFVTIWKHDFSNRGGWILKLNLNSEKPITLISVKRSPWNKSGTKKIKE